MAFSNCILHSLYNPRCVIRILFYIPALLLQVKEAFDQKTTELLQLRATLTQSQQGEQKSGSLVQELTAMVKEQKNRIAELIKAKRDAVNELKVNPTVKVGDLLQSLIRFVNSG